MKKITCFIADLSSGGAEHQITILANTLADKGYLVSLVTFGNSEDHYPVSEKVERERIRHNGSSIGKLMAIYCYFLRIKSDCVISFGTRENLLVLIPLLFKRKIKVLAGERNYTVSEPPLYEKLLIKFFYKRANFIVPNSYSQKNYIIKNKPQYTSKTVTIINYTEIDKFPFAPAPNNNPIRIGVFSRYHAQKNCLRFLDTVAIARTRTQRPFVVDWYGSQHFSYPMLQNYFDTVKKRVLELGLQDIVNLHDAVKNVSDLLPQYDAICLPSLKEGFSNSISEAICCGKPMLVSDISDNSILVHHGKNGFLFNPEDIESIADAMLCFLKLGNEARCLMGQESRKIASGLFSKEKFLNAYMELIES